MRNTHFSVVSERIVRCAETTSVTFTTCDGFITLKALQAAGHPGVIRHVALCEDRRRWEDIFS